MTRGVLSADTLGLRLAEVKEVLRSVQQTMVTQQVKEFLEQQRHGGQCGAQQSLKGHHPLVVRTLFGTLSLPSPRLRRCACAPRRTRSVSPLVAVLPERTAPELAYLDATWASLMSYGLTVNLLTEVLPLDHDVHTTGVWRQVHRVAGRVERELGPEHSMFLDGCPREWSRLPRPEGPMTVGIDGGDVRGRQGKTRADGHFDVIAGKSLADDTAKCFAFVHRYDTKPKRRLCEVLHSQGMQMNQQLTFLSDGGETVRDLQLYLNPHAEHVLDWFHVTMRLTVMRQLAKGLRSTDCPAIAKDVDRQLGRLTWSLGHGTVFRALQTIELLDRDIEGVDASAAQRTLLKALREFAHYITVNRPFIPNDGDRYRNGEHLATGFVESTINQVGRKRFVKHQSMRWTKRGAHLLLQVRTRTLNDALRSTFEGWYPGLRQAADSSSCSR